MSVPTAGSLRREIPVTKREIFGWAMFDFANSSYTTVVITAVYGAFFVANIVPPGSAARDSYWSTAILISMVVSLVLSPLVGAIVDLSGKKKSYLIASCLICSLGTAGLYFAQPGQVWLAIWLVVIGNTGFMMSEAFCSSFLPELATSETMGKISGLGWGVGYLGGLASVFIASQVIITADPVSDHARYVAQNQWAMLAMGAFCVLAALPTFLLVKNRSVPAPGYAGASIGKLLRAGWAEFKQTAAVARQYRILFQFLVAFMVYMAGLDAIVKFVGIYAREDIGLTGGEFVVLFLALQLSAVAGALGFGWLEGRLGPKRTVMGTLFWWIVGVLGIYFLETLSQLTGLGPKQLFYGLGLFAGAGIGATQASSRTVVGLLAPKARSAQMFGFWAMFSRLGSILGVGFGYVADLFGSRRAGVLLVVIFFVVGAILLQRVDIDRGVREANPSAG